MDVLKLMLKIFTILLLSLFILSVYVNPLINYLYHRENAYTEITERSMILNTLLMLIFLILIPVLWLYSFNNLTPREILHHLKLRKQNLGISISLALLAFSLMMVVLLIAGMLIKYYTGRVENDVARSIATKLSIPAIIFIGIVQSSGEEIFFRGFLIEKLSLKNNKHAGVLLSSLLFGLAHLSYGTLYQIILPFIIGCILGYTLLKSQNLISVIIPHAMYNTLALLLMHYYFSIIL